MSSLPPHNASSATQSQDSLPACVMAFNAGDASGAGGLASDVITIASVGGHPLAVTTGVYVRDTAEVIDHWPLDEEAVTEQARAALEDLPVQAIKVGFVGTPDNLGAIAALADEWGAVPVIAYMPDLSWWRNNLIEQYHDAFAQLLLPQASVLVGHQATLSRWLLPDWASDRPPSARDIAQAAAQYGTPYVLVTGIQAPGQHIENVLASAETVLASGKFERFDATFIGAGDTLAAALTALVACGVDLAEAMAEALTYLDRSLQAGFRPGMGHVLPDRMFWAQPDAQEGEDAPAPGDSADAPESNLPSLEGFSIPSHDTKH